MNKRPLGINKRDSGLDKKTKLGDAVSEDDENTENEIVRLINARDDQKLEEGKEKEEEREGEGEGDELICEEPLNIHLYYANDKDSVDAWTLRGKREEVHGKPGRRWTDLINVAEALKICKYSTLSDTWGYYNGYFPEKYELETHSMTGECKDFGGGLQQYTDILMRNIDKIVHNKAARVSDYLDKMHTISMDRAIIFGNENSNGISQFLNKYLLETGIFERMCSLATYYKLRTQDERSMSFIAMSVGAQIILYIHKGNYESAANLAKLTRKAFRDHIIREENQ